MNRIRQIVVGATAILLIGGSFTIVVYLIGRRPDTDRLSHIRLPVVPEATDGGHHSFIVGVDKHGQLDIHDTPLTKTQLKKILEGRWRKRGDFPVFIGADERADLADVWSAVETCCSAGPRSAGFLVALEPDQQFLGFLPFRPLTSDTVREHENTVHIRISRTTLQLNGKNVDRKTLQGELFRIAESRGRLPVRIAVRPGLKHKRVIEILRLCNGLGVCEIAIEGITDEPVAGDVSLERNTGTEVECGAEKERGTGSRVLERNDLI